VTIDHEMGRSRAKPMLALGLMVAALLLTNPELGLAQTSGGCALQPLNTAMLTIMNFLTGTFATTCATVAVAAVGYMAFTSRIPWGWAFSVIVAIALIFGAPQIVQTLSSGMGGAQSASSNC
jgi:type IV secretion system protein VirB2